MIHAKQQSMHWLLFRGSNNTRDLGGYRSKDGRAIQRSRLIRSGALSQISVHAGRILNKKYHVRTMVDLRTEGERIRHPIPSIDGIELRYVPVLENAMLGITSDDRSTLDKIKSILAAGLNERQFMEQVYTQIISDPMAISAYRQLFELLLSQEDGATLFFCSHGRDRTGIAVLLILSALDIPEETIRADYLLAPKREKAQLLLINLLEKTRRITPEQAAFARSFSSPNAERFDHALQWIQSHYGSVDSYLENEGLLSKMERKKFQQLYMEDIVV